MPSATVVAWVKRHWLVILFFLTGVLLIANVAAFYPGFLSNDSVDQLTQAKGDKSLEDWHPPAMVVVWRMLMAFSGGRVGTMLIWQCLLLWSALAIFAVYLYRITGKRRWSLAPLALGIMPFTITISGVIWKDVQMAVSLLVAAALLLVAGRLIGLWRYVTLAVVGLSIIYAISLRYNALAAVPPLLLLMWHMLPSKRIGNVACAAIVACGLLVTPVIGKFTTVVSTHPTASIMLDDIVHIYSAAAIRQLDISSQERQALLAVKRRCEIKQVPVSVWIGCATEDDMRTITQTKYNDTKQVWIDAILHHPIDYASYRLGQFWVFLAPRTPSEAYVWHEGVVPNQYNIATMNDKVATSIVRGYVQRTAFDFGFIFRPYTWLLAGLLLGIIAWQRRNIWQHAYYCGALAVSGVLYILSYVPVVAAYDFRYSYWSCLAISIAALFAFVDARRTPKLGTTSTKKKI